MRIIEHLSLPVTMLPGIEHQTLASGATGGAHLSVWQQTVAPGGATPVHFHDCEELVLVESGCGELHGDGGCRRFAAGVTLVIPPAERHRICNTGGTPLTLVGIFSGTPVGTFGHDGAPLPLPWES